MTDDNALTRTQKTLRKQQLADVLKCLEHGPSRRVLAQLIDLAGVFSYPAVDATSQYRDGRRSLGLDLVGMIQAVDTQGFIKLQQELINASAERAREIGKAETQDDE